MLSSLLYLYLFWLVYILVMGIYRAHLSGRLVGVTKYLSYPVVILGYAMDVCTQFTFASAIFCAPPHLRPAVRDFSFWGRTFRIWYLSGDWLVTSRLIRYRDQMIGWRAELAAWICDNLLDPFDPTGNHC